MFASKYVALSLVHYILMHFSVQMVFCIWLNNSKSNNYYCYVNKMSTFY